MIHICKSIGSPRLCPMQTPCHLIDLRPFVVAFKRRKCIFGYSTKICIFFGFSLSWKFEFENVIKQWRLQIHRLPFCRHPNPPLPPSPRTAHRAPRTFPAECLATVWGFNMFIRRLGLVKWLCLWVWLRGFVCRAGQANNATKTPDETSAAVCQFRKYYFSICCIAILQYFSQKLVSSF